MVESAGVEVEGGIERVSGAGQGRRRGGGDRAGRPIARIVPVKEEVEGDSGRLKALERSGEISLGTGRLPEGFRSLKKPGDSGGRVRSAVSEEREEGW